MVVLRLHFPKFFSVFITLWRNTKFGWHLTVHVIRRTSWHYGITSKVNDEMGKHWLLFDFDVKDGKVRKWLDERFTDYIWYETENGSHAVVFTKVSRRQAFMVYGLCPYVDMKWVAIGLKRGYWFLHTREDIKGEFERMKVRY